MPKLKKNELGLRCHDKVRWLLQNEDEVLNAVKLFAIGRADTNHITIAGPPPEQDINHYLINKNETIPLPTITLRLKMIVGNLTQDPGIEIHCSDAHLEEIGRWQLEKLLRMAKPKLMFQA